MEFHPQYTNFVNDQKINYGPLLRFNFNILLLMHKLEHHSQSKYKVNWYTSVLKSLKNKRVLRPPKYIRGYGTIHRTLVIMLTHDDLRFVQELGITSPNFVKNGDLLDDKEQKKSNKQIFNALQKFAYENDYTFDAKTFQKELDDLWITVGYEPPKYKNIFENIYFYFFNKY